MADAPLFIAHGGGERSFPPKTVGLQSSGQRHCAGAAPICVTAQMATRRTSVTEVCEAVLPTKNEQPPPPYIGKEERTYQIGGPSTLNEMCLVFLFYYPRNFISSCQGYPDIQYVAQQLGQEAADATEGMMAINLVEWDKETVQKAEKACKEADQIMLVKTIDREVNIYGGKFSLKVENVLGKGKEAISKTHTAK
ncbi:DBH-like monooxygenase protein 2 [Varanus komodoensis]|nr:DBH-like monooxygenase protein 2 [Varanus komodoensis]